MPRQRARVDKNQQEIVKGLRGIGASVEILSAVGKGCPDIVVGFRDANYLLEIKTADGTLTPDQIVWHNAWNGHKAVVRTLQEAYAAIGAVEADWMPVEELPAPKPAKRKSRRKQP